ncbi:MAG TPA: DmsC/YnfH family molybdoenzyme membrane anchor subunit [Polyangiaceae bacterium]|nr:DmsC/YnfH family molybdoenzyme membrane anchor subunit [Polyangiaceae bacterium]
MTALRNRVLSPQPKGAAPGDYESGVVVSARRREPGEPRRLPLVNVAAALAAQHELTAVERFSNLHDENAVPGRQHYRALLPLTPPRSGEQYAFEVDLDACTGCKACVAACHTMNGLDGGETFRAVGLLVGGTVDEPRLQTVTSSCHHCLEPACMSGCPVGAYEKDALTGIVRHLDDQCFGCQYCTLMCPYDAPKYNEAKGIVRKCDMCSGRLAHGEAPACVEACPNEAIAIRVVEKAVVAAAADARHFVRGAADRDNTLPTTSFKTARATPDNMLPVDYYRVAVSPAHAPLVAMLTLSQWAVGLTWAEAVFADSRGSVVLASVEVGVLGVALLASLLHLGRPWLAPRAVLGVKTSWLSREVLAFGILMKLALLKLGLTLLPSIPSFHGRELVATLGGALVQVVPALGAFAVFCSVMVYVATRRSPWSFAKTSLRFFGTTALLGAASFLALFNGQLDGASRETLAHAVAAIGLLKLGFDTWLLLEARSRRFSGDKRMALAMLGPLGRVGWSRLSCLVVGAAVPLTLLASNTVSAAGLWLGTALLLGAELAERFLFFSAAPSLRMPGNLR